MTDLPFEWEEHPDEWEVHPDISTGITEHDMMAESLTELGFTEDEADVLSDRVTEERGNIERVLRGLDDLIAEAEESDEPEDPDDFPLYFFKAMREKVRGILEQGGPIK